MVGRVYARAAAGVRRFIGAVRYRPVVEHGVLVIGGGGHALVSIEVLRAAGHDVAGCVTRGGASSTELDHIGVKVLGTDRDLCELVSDAYPRAFVAVGENGARRRLSEAVLALPADRWCVASAHTPSSPTTPTSKTVYW